MAHDASATWSGFNYQGKVALFYTLELINNLIESDSGNDLRAYSLRLEWNEDFEILKNDKPISFHQVKAYKEKSFSSYENALLELILALKNNESVQGYMHTWNQINLPTERDSLGDAIKTKIKEVINEYDDAVDKPKTIIGKALSDASNKPKKAAILRKAFEDDPNIHTKLNDLCNDDEVFNRLSSYQYPDHNSFCELDEINKFIEKELKKYYGKKGRISTTKQIGRAFHFFLGKLDHHIIERHKNFSRKIPIDIPFIEIVDVIEYDFENMSDEYLQFEFKKKFLSIYEEFCSDQDLCPDNECSKDEHCHLKQTFNLINILPPEALWSYYKTFSPHINLTAEQNIENAFNIDPQAILLVLLNIFHSLDSEKSIDQRAQKRICYQGHNGSKNFYLPTTILNSQSRRLAGLAKNIIDNKSQIESLYEIQSLVADRTFPTIDCLKKEVNRNRDVGELSKYCADYPEKKRERINEIFQNIRLISTEKAMDEINAN